tara:strand:+ start:608 stop:1138 length:531 start_codon:yes stop_codon:yes gene_type:complete
MSTPEIITVNSEALEAQIRDLLPSQNGFGSELQASNVIMPIIDLTATAEGSGLSETLQSSLAFGNATAFDVVNTTTILANSAGFWRFYGFITLGSSSGSPSASFTITDGSSTKQLFEQLANNGTGSTNVFDFTVFLPAGHSVSAISGNTLVHIAGTYRQVATVTGELVNPVGFVAE